jgi:ABC-type uncharacterized transport system permease subunit
MPTTGQLALLILAAALFAVSVIASVLRSRKAAAALEAGGGARATQRTSPVQISTLTGGIVAAIGVIVWHAASRGHWLPLNDNFEALVWLGALLALFVLYIQTTRPLGALDWFVTPVAVLLLLGAAFFGRVEYHDYVNSTWSWLHRATSYAGAVAFAIAAAAGAMYVVTSRRLRSKTPVGPNLGSLERLEHLTMTAVTLGFALLTIGTITGGVRMLEGAKNTPPTKLVLALAVWVVYAIVLHAPINPSFRGRKVAVLSMVGFVLMIGTIVAVQFLPESAT